VNGIEAEFEGQVTVVRLNAAEPDNARLQTDYGVRGHPSVVILDESGRVTQRYIGAQTAETLRAALNEAVP